MSKAFLVSDEEVYILNSDGYPKRIPASQYDMFYNPKVEFDQWGNRKVIPVIREDYKKYKKITREEYETISGMIVHNGKWVPKSSIIKAVEPKEIIPTPKATKPKKTVKRKPRAKK